MAPLYSVQRTSVSQIFLFTIYLPGYLPRFEQLLLYISTMQLFKLAAIAALAVTVASNPLPSDRASDIVERQSDNAGILICPGMRKWTMH